jgi:hypothetical protein
MQRLWQGAVRGLKCPGRSPLHLVADALDRVASLAAEPTHGALNLPHGLIHVNPQPLNHRRRLSAYRLLDLALRLIDRTVAFFLFHM